MLGVFYKIRRMLWNHKIKDQKISILSNNCIAGFLYNDYNLKFNSPTINLQMSPKDFIKFCNNIEHYLIYEPKEVKQPIVSEFVKLGGTIINFPVGTIDDITIYFQHYTTFEEAKVKWQERKKRINFDNIFVILVDLVCDSETVRQFKELPFKKKIILTDNQDSLGDGIFDIGKMKKNRYWYSKINFWGLKKYYERFKFDDWINNV